MYHFILCFLIIFLFSFQANGKKTDYISTTNPDQIIVNLTKSPSTSISISWRTKNTVSEGHIEYFLKNSSNTLSKKADLNIINTNNYILIKNDPITHRYSVTLKNLLANQKYTYRACNLNCSDWYNFQTAPNNEKTEFQFMYLGDPQTGLKNWSKNYNRTVLANSKSRFTVISGDLVNKGGNRAQFDQLFGEATTAFANTGLLPVLGNHDIRGNGKNLYKQTYMLPQNGPNKKESNYWIKYGATLFLMLNSNSIDKYSEQANWIEDVINNTPARWIILAFHHPIWSSHPIRDNKTLRKIWMPIIEKMGVDLVLNGHDHAYMRTYPTIQGKKVEKGPIYVVSFSGSKIYPYAKRSITAVGMFNTSTYQLIDISYNTLKYRAFTWQNILVDEFTVEHK